MVYNYHYHETLWRRPSDGSNRRFFGIGATLGRPRSDDARIAAGDFGSYRPYRSRRAALRAYARDCDRRRRGTGPLGLCKGLWVCHALAATPGDDARYRVLCRRRLTMQFTAAAILLLEQDGKLKLDDTVSKYVPELKVAADVTIAQLLTQTSGLPNYATGTTPDMTRSVKLADIFAAVDLIETGCTAGERFCMRTTRSTISSLGLIVQRERAARYALRTFSSSGSFIPRLIMKRPFVPRGRQRHLSRAHATGYTRAARGFVPAPTWDPAWLEGSSGLVSTIDDLAKWDIEMPVLLRVDAVRTMYTPAAATGPTHYGMGWVIDSRGGREFVWSNGEISGYRAMNAQLPGDHISVIVFFRTRIRFTGALRFPSRSAHACWTCSFRQRTLVSTTPVCDPREGLAEPSQRGKAPRPIWSLRLRSAPISPTIWSRARELRIARAILQVIVPICEQHRNERRHALRSLLVRYPRAQYHYDFEVAPNGKIDGIALVS